MAAESMYLNEYQLAAMLQAMSNAYAQGGAAAEAAAAISNATSAMTAENAYAAYQYLNEVQIISNQLGSAQAAGGTLGMGVRTAAQVGGQTAADIAAQEAAAALNSNVASMASQSQVINVPLNATSTGTGVALSAGAKNAAGVTVPTALGHAMTSIIGAGIGLKLGVWIDGALYNANPDFWDAHNMSELNPQTWSGSVVGKGLLNWADYPQAEVLMDANGQMYANNQLFAIIAQYLAHMGVFNGSTGASVDNDVDPSKLYNEYNLQSLAVGERVYASMSSDPNNYYGEITIASQSSKVIGGLFSTNTIGRTALFVSESPFTLTYHTVINGQSQSYDVTSDELTTKDGTILYAHVTGWDWNNMDTYAPATNVAAGTYDYGEFIADMGYIMIYGTEEGGTGLAGFNPFETMPDPETLPENAPLADLINALLNQFPELDTDKLTIGVLQPDGEIEPRTYWPIGWPEGGLDPQPVSVPSNVGAIDPDNDPQSKRGTDTQTAPDPDTDPEGDGGKGSGTTPTVTTPTGSASALYKIYNPTDAAVNSLGAWLWSSNFIDQILKMFNSPVDAIISLHKIYGTPHTSGSQNIKVGYLDSGVPAPVVDQQYITIDCGSVNMYEYFGNVFDYHPYTEISLYLPFIGIQQLDVADVMRGVIKIVYHIDVITGAVLAEVKVTRDNGAGGVIYQFTGSCAEHYPVSAGSYMGIVTGAAGIAAGVAGTIMSGGALAPMLLGAGASLGGMHANIQKSGGFSANAGAMGIKKPYLIISRPQSAMAQNYESLSGKGANTYVTIGACKGRIRVKYVNLSIEGATREDLDQIEAALKEGVIL